MSPGFHVHLLLLLLLMSLIKYTLQRQRRPIPPLVEKLNKDQDVSPPVRKNAKVCDRCTDMYMLADREYWRKKNKTLFCIRLLQIERCINKHRKDCMIIVLTLTTGIKFRKGKINCSKMNIDPTDVMNIKPTSMKKKHGRHCRYRPHNKKLNRPMYCGMFGDPHLKTFYDVRQTCIVAGAWTLVDNEYLAVQVTNEIVQHTETTSATATTKISIIFKERRRGCIQQKIYEATSEFLPTIFKDGTSATGSRCKTHIKKKNQEVVIKSCRSNTTILIRKFGKYLTFNILTPYEIVNKSSGLCRTGCPASELVDYHSFLQNRINQVSSSYEGRTSSAKVAMTTCANENLTDFYYDSCVFDLLTTGDTQFTEAARASMIDAKNMDPKLRLRRENSAVLSIMNSPSAGGKMTSSKSLMLIIILFSVFSWLTDS